MFEDNSALIDEQEQEKEKEKEKDNLTVIDNMTLENTFKLLKLGSVLSDLDNDLREVKKGKKTIEDHRKYFTEIDDKLKKLGLIYHPDMVQRQGGSKEEILTAEAIQKKITATRNILGHFNENFSQKGDFKYSSFSKIEVNFFGNEEKINEITYATLNKIKGLYDFKHDNFILNLNGFLRLSQASIRGFIANDFDCFLKEKANAERYFKDYLNGCYMLFNHLESFHKQCKQDNCMEPIATQMLEECNIQGSILIQIEKFLKQNSLQRHALINRDDAKNRLYLSCINNEQSYKKADKDVALAFVEYMNVLVMCNEIWNKIMYEKIPWCGWMNSKIPGMNYFTGMNYWIGSEVIRKTVADNEITKNSEDILFLRKISHYLVTYYCYGNEGSRKIAAELLDINFDLLGEEDALQLLTQVIDVYSNYLEKEFRPEKDFFDQITEVQMKFINKMKSSCDELCEYMRQHHQQLAEIRSERNKIIEQAIESCTEYLKDVREDRRKKHQELMDKMEQEKNEMTLQREQERNEEQSHHQELCAEMDKYKNEMLAQMDTILKVLKARANAAAQKQQAGPSHSGKHKPSETDPNSQVDQPTTSGHSKNPNII